MVKNRKTGEKAPRQTRDPVLLHLLTDRLAVDQFAELPVAIALASAAAGGGQYVLRIETDDIEVKAGRFGPYIKHGGKNYKIPKKTDPAKLTAEDCMQIINNQK